MFFFWSSSSEFSKLEAMDGASAAASDRILLEPYKYLLQLPGESDFPPNGCRVWGKNEAEEPRCTLFGCFDLFKLLRDATWAKQAVKLFVAWLVRASG